MSEILTWNLKTGFITAFSRSEKRYGYGERARKSDPIDEAEARRYLNLRENPEATRILNEEVEKAYSPRQQQPQDPYLEQVRKEHEENQKLGNEEIERINRMPKRKQQEWLESEDRVLDV